VWGGWPHRIEWHFHSCANRKSSGHRNPGFVGYANANLYSDTHSNTHSHTHSHTHNNSDSEPGGHSNPGTVSHAYSDGHLYTNTDANTDAHNTREYRTQAACGCESLGRQYRRRWQWHGGW